MTLQKVGITWAHTTILPPDGIVYDCGKFKICGTFKILHVFSSKILTEHLDIHLPPMECTTQA